MQSLVVANSKFEAVDFMNRRIETVYTWRQFKVDGNAHYVLLMGLWQMLIYILHIQMGTEKSRYLTFLVAGTINRRGQ